jgi:hypothetical protein
MLRPICEAVGRPNMRFVPIKNIEQQAVLALHRGVLQRLDRIGQHRRRDRCATGNGRVRSFGDNVPFIMAVHPGDREGIDTASSRAVWGPGKFRKHNVCELLDGTSLASKSQSC